MQTQAYGYQPCCDGYDSSRSKKCIVNQVYVQRQERHDTTQSKQNLSLSGVMG